MDEGDLIWPLSMYPCYRRRRRVWPTLGDILTSRLRLEFLSCLPSVSININQIYFILHSRHYLVLYTEGSKPRPSVDSNHHPQACIYQGSWAVKSTPVLLLSRVCSCYCPVRYDRGEIGRVTPPTHNTRHGVTIPPSPPSQPFQQLSARNSSDYTKIASLLYLEIDWSRGQSNYYYRFYPSLDQLSIIRLDPTDSLLPLSGLGKWFQTISSLANILASLFFKSGNLGNDKGNCVQQMRFRYILVELCILFSIWLRFVMIILANLCYWSSSDSLHHITSSSICHQICHNSKLISSASAPPRRMSQQNVKYTKYTKKSSVYIWPVVFFQPATTRKKRRVFGWHSYSPCRSISNSKA